jgi:hypothetical protein
MGLNITSPQNLECGACPVQISFLHGPDRIGDYRNAALVVAHPGHELKVFGWLSESAPRVHVLTDGSGAGLPRLSSTAKLLRPTGAVPGEVFGSVSDAEMYRAILGKRMEIFLEIVDGLAASLVENGIDFVAGDATEGFNPTHDVCRSLLNAAVCIAQRATGKTIANYEFCLTEWEQHCREVHDQRCLHLRLDDALLHEKLRSAEEYAELKAEIQQAISTKGEEYFRIECLRKVTVLFPRLSSVAKPYYETFGEERVAQGKYEFVIRYEQHMVPILKAVRKHAQGRTKLPEAFPASTGAAADSLPL